MTIRLADFTETRPSWLAHDLFFAGVPCKGGPGRPNECDQGASCWRHKNLFAIAERIIRRRGA